MVKRKLNIITNNKEIYEKFNMLNFSPEIILTDVKAIQVNKIIRNINREYKILDVQNFDDYIIIKKMKPLNFNLYLR